MTPAGETAEGPELQAASAAPGIHRIALPTPFAVGRVNCYLLEGRPLTLVDTGPNSGKSLDALELALAALGHAIEDLDLIVITHQHMDHLGLTEVLVRRSGAEVAALDLLAGYLERFSAGVKADDAFSMDIMRRHGVPNDLATALATVGAAFRAFGSSARVTRPLGDGDELVLGDRRLQVMHRPGHSPSDTLFWDADRGILLGGDHLLPHISSNPLISRPLDGPGTGERPRALIAYIASMRLTRELPITVVLPGHGDPFGDHTSLIDERLRMHGRRADKLLGMLAPGSLTAFELAQRMWGNVAVTQAYLTLSEALGHMDLLVADGRAEEIVEAGISRFRATQSSVAIGQSEAD